MIAQILFTILLAGVIGYAWISYRQSPIVGLLAVLVAMAGMYFVWMPGHATVISSHIGIGRGVDLILYTWVGISLLVVLNLHLKLRLQTEMVTALARKMAIALAQQNDARS